MRLRTVTSVLVALALVLLSGWIAVEEHRRTLAALDSEWRVVAAVRSAPPATEGVGSTPLLVLVVGLAFGLAVSRRARRRRLVADTLRSSQERFRALVQHASDMLLIVEPGGTVRSATGACNAVLGELGEGLEGASLRDRVHVEDAERVGPVLAEALAHGADVASVWRMRHADGRWIHVEVIVSNLTGQEGVDGLVLTCRDVTARAAFEEHLRHRAYHDPLTQLPNRDLLLDRIEQGLARPDRTVALLFVDLDDFKVVNDSLGHAAGDGVLIAVASRLRGCLRSADTAARLGGDEFAVLLDEIVTEEEADAVGHRIVDTLRRPFLVHGEPVHVGVSVGLAITRTETIAVDELLRRADFAMYAAKHNGKNRVERFDPAVEAELIEHFEPTAPVNEEAERVTWFARAEEQRAEIEAVLASPAERISQVFQPIVDLRTGFVAAYEALSRFVGSRRPPNAWFAQAHRCGLGIELELVAAQAQIAVPDRPAGTRVSINLSPSALLSIEGEHGLGGDLSHLTVEVTEDELVTEGTALEDRLADLRRRGARLAVDDVGAGYAGLKQVVRLKPDLLKLDRSLVDGVSEDPAKVAMVDALVRYARFIGADVCAEGIETLEDLRTLADLDVTYGQGFGLGRPGAPWVTVDPEAAAVCVSAQSAFIRHDEGDDRAAVSSELRLERVCHRIGAVAGPEDLQELLEPIRDLLRVDRVALSLLETDGERLLTVMAECGPVALDNAFDLADYPATAAALASGASLQVLASDVAADPGERELLAELGYGTLLLVPLPAGSRVVGVLEAYAREERPWSRAQVHCARILSYQLGFVLALDAPARALSLASPASG